MFYKTANNNKQTKQKQTIVTTNKLDLKKKKQNPNHLEHTNEQTASEY